LKLLDNVILKVNKFLHDNSNGISWLDVKYIEESSSFISSYIGIHGCCGVFNVCPFLIIVIGLFFIPLLLHGVSFDVEEKRIELPNLPSINISPSVGRRFLIFWVSTNFLPKSNSSFLLL